MANFDITKLRVLIVEDNRHFRDLVRTILEALGAAEVEEAEDGEQGIAMLRVNVPDLAILDWRMDNVDGIEFLRRVRDEATSPAPMLPVVMVTGYGEQALIAAARDAGVNDFLAKPVSAKGLLSRIVDVIANPRPFVRADGYFGSDRRVRDLPRAEDERRMTPPVLIDVPPRFPS